MALSIRYFKNNFRIYKALGCPHDCGDGVVGPEGEELRIKGQHCLGRLHRINPAKFHAFFKDTVRKRPLQETMDFLHAFLGFCFDPTSMVQSPSCKYLIKLKYFTGLRFCHL